MNGLPAIVPFAGRLTSTAFHVRNVAEFQSDLRVRALQRIVEVMEGRLPGDASPCFCLLRQSAPRQPLVIARQPGDVLIGEGDGRDPPFDDRDGWLGTLQAHVHEADAGAWMPRCSPAVAEPATAALTPRLRETEANSLS